MEINLKIIQIIIKVIFLGIIPFFLVYFRFRKKISTGFAVGAFLASFIVSLIGVASVYTDPFDSFYDSINSNSYEEAKKNYRIIVQYGPDKLSKIDEDKVIYKKHYKRMRKELVTEYENIADRYLHKNDIKEIKDCGKLFDYEKILNNLRHALRLSNYALSLGGKNEELKNIIAKRINEGEKKFSSLRDRCE